MTNDISAPSAWGIKPSRVSEETAVDAVVNSIRNAIVSGAYKPGDRLPPESELVASLGVSRSTIREAMKTLQAYGVVKIKQGSGTFITQDKDDVATRALIMRYALLQPTEEECWEYRAMIEGEVMKNAIRYAGSSDIEQLRQNFRKMTLMRTNPDATAKLDVEFHITLGNLTPNCLIRSTYALTIGFLEPTFTRNHNLANHVEKTLKVHAKTIDAIERRDLTEESIRMLIQMNEEAWIKNP